MENSACAHIYSHKCTVGLNSYEILHGSYVCCIAKDSKIRKDENANKMDTSEPVVNDQASEKPKELLTPTHIAKTKESSMPKTPSDPNIVSSSQKRKAEVLPPKPEKKRPGRPPLSQTQQVTPKSAKDCLCMKVSCQTSYQRIHACLSCDYFACYIGGHIHEHAREEGHPLAIDTNLGHVFCFECGDYQYDADFDRIARKQKLTAACNKGMRGIINLGNTCYMSVILLSLAHAPVFRDYLFSLKHKCEIHNISRESEVPGSALEKLKPVCFVCEMSVIIQEFFCGTLEPFSPHRVLYLLWLHADRYKDPGQHDAHEFFLTLLDFLHLHHQGQNEKDMFSIDLSCNCIIDTIFTFSLHQEYTFTDCKHKSIHVNACRGMFLELHSTDNDGVPLVTDEHKQMTTLIDLLKKNQSEVAKKTCESCNEIKEYHKVTTLNRLPIILTFFWQQYGMHSNKLYVNFPEFLDMTPFMNTSSKQNDNPENGLSNVSKNKFYLFAVVVYSPSLAANGRDYTCYVRRHKKEWFLMEDEYVTQVSLEKVLEAKKACLLFYHKETLEFEDKKIVDL